ncbi:MAG: hypothetical protein HOE90_21155 [Bacteriovoracaceae bacterium]|nr:hypothetical protein [Bacteriovoracaceae bacterium]
MKYIFLLITLVTWSSLLAAETRHYRLSVDKHNWETLLKNKWSNEYVACDISSAELSSICKIRVHGGISRKYPKLSFRVILPSGSPKLSYSRKITLKSDFGDGTYLRNYLTFKLFENLTNIPTPKAQLSYLWVNNSPYGLMLDIEKIGKKFLDSRKMSEGSLLFRSDPTGELYKNGAGNLIPLPNESMYVLAYKHIGEAKKYPDVLINLIDGLWESFTKNEPSFVPDSFDVDDVVDFLAIMGIVQNFDYSKKNYYLLKRNGKFRLLPWDLDQTWGCLWDSVNSDSICDEFFYNKPHKTGHRKDELISVYPNQRDFNLLYQIVWSDPALSKMVQNRICDFLDSKYWNERLLLEAKKMKQDILPFLKKQADPKNRYDSVSSYISGFEEILSFHKLRAKYLKRKLCL